MKNKFYVSTKSKESNLRGILYRVFLGGYFSFKRLYGLFIDCFTSLRLFALVRL